MGRGKVELKRIEKTTNRQVTFSKRKNGILKKAFELSLLCDAEVALILFSPSGKLYQFSTHDNHMEKTIARYRKEVGLLDSNHQSINSTKLWENEMQELERSINTMETRLRHLAGEDISKLGIKELKQLERQLKIGVERVRSKKRYLVSQHINLLKIKEKALREENHRLRKRLIELHDHNDITSFKILGSIDNGDFQRQVSSRTVFN